MSHVITASDGTKILITDLLAPGDFSIESYQVATLLGYKQQSSTRKQILTDWRLLFTAGIDYVMSHDKLQLEVYETAWRQHMKTSLKPLKPERGRMFLRPSGLRKVFERTSKDTDWLEDTFASFFNPKQKAPAPMPAPVRTPVITKTAPVQTPVIMGHVDPSQRKKALKKKAEVLSTRQQYEVLETLLDHLKHITEPGLKRLALMNAELALGRELNDIRQLIGLEAPAPLASPDAEEEVLPPSASPSTGCVVLEEESVEEEEEELARARNQKEELARAYLAKRPVTQGPLFDNIPNVHYGLKVIGEKAGGYSAVQAGKAADAVALRLGHSHDDIRRKKLSFNDLPELPDTTSGKLRKMYRFNSQFANHVIVELRSSPHFVPATHPLDSGPFGLGGDKFPNLSRGPFDEA